MKVLGITLTVYGGGLAVAAVILLIGLSGRLSGVRQFIRKIGTFIGEAGDASIEVGETLLAKSKPAAEKIAGKLDDVAGIINRTAGFMGSSGSFFSKVGQGLDSVNLKIPQPQIKRLRKNFQFDLPTGIDVDHKKIDFKVTKVSIPWDFSLRKSRTGLNLDFNYVAGLKLTGIQPLKPVGGLFGSLADTFQSVNEQLEGAGEKIKTAEEFITEKTIPALEKISAETNSIGDKLKQTKDNLNAFAGSKWVAVIPALVIGIIALIHLVIAGIGMGFLLG